MFLPPSCFREFDPGMTRRKIACFILDCSAEGRALPM
jgi:hypothetical protein